jgi:hypothetical protein
MPRYKAAAFHSVRALVRAKPWLERRLLAELSADDAEVWATFVATEWLEVELATRLLTAAAGVLFESDPTPVRTLGRAMAEEQLTGVYRFVVRLASPQLVLSQASRLWARYHDSGVASVEWPVPGAARATLHVHGYGALPERQRENIAGYAARALELGGAENVRVTRGGSPADWQWLLTWR